MEGGQALATLWKTKQNTIKNKVTRREYVSGIPEGSFSHAACRGLGVVCKAVLAPVHQSYIVKLSKCGLGGEKLGQNLFKSLLLRVFSEISKRITAFVVCLTLGLNAPVFQSRLKASFCSFWVCALWMGILCFTTWQAKILENCILKNLFLQVLMEKASVRKVVWRENLQFVTVTYCSLNAGWLSKVGGEGSNEMLLIQTWFVFWLRKIF